MLHSSAVKLQQEVVTLGACPARDCEWKVMLKTTVMLGDMAF